MASKEFIGSTDLLVIFNLIKTELAKYVKAVSGKGLSTEDFTTELKNKLDGITFEEAFSETSENGVQNKVIKAALDLKANLASPALTGTPTAPTAAAGTETTQIATTAFVTGAIATALGSITGIKFDNNEGAGYSNLEALETAHPTGEDGVIYLVNNSGSAPNVKDEYFWNGNYYELFGTTSVDLSGYLKSTDVAEISTDDVNAAWTSVFGS